MSQKKQKKHHHPWFEPRTPRSEGQHLPVHLFRFLHDNLSDWYVSIQIDVWEKVIKKRKQHPPQGDDASTAEAATCRVGRGDQGEARPAISAPRGGPHLDLGCLQLKTWSRSGFWIAETTWPTYLYICTLSVESCPQGLGEHYCNYSFFWLSGRAPDSVSTGQRFKPRPLQLSSLYSLLLFVWVFAAFCWKGLTCLFCFAFFRLATFFLLSSAALSAPPGYFSCEPVLLLWYIS